MPARLTQEQAIAKAKAVHGDRYDYSKVVYKNNSTKIEIICKIHGSFFQKLNAHVDSKQGCPICNSKKKGHDKVIKEFKKTHGNKYDYSKTVYKDAKTNIIITCPKHGDFIKRPDHHRNGSGCPECLREELIEKEFANFLKKAKKIHGDKYDYSKVNYVNNHTPVEIICDIHGSFFQAPSNHLQGANCPICVGNQLKTQEQVISEFKELYGDTYDYSLVEYKNSSTKVKIICPVHGVFEVTPTYFLRGIGCQFCNGNKNKPEDLIRQFKEIHGDKYDYSKAIITNKGTPIEIICKKHNYSFWNTPNNHIHLKRGCPKCAYEKIGINSRVSEKEVLRRFKKAHGDKYDYSLVKYKGNKASKVKIICPIHGVFEQLPSEHAKRGCPRCNGFNKTTDDIKELFKEVHNDRYDYSLVEYETSKKKVKIICKEHGIFKQSPSEHIRGRGCPSCAVSTSKAEIAITKWLKSNLNTEIETRKRFYYSTENRRLFYELDIFLPSLNLGIEYNGLEFHHTHGNTYSGKNKFHKDKYYHRDKSKLFREKYGIRIIHIWEHEWINKPDIVKNILKMQLNIPRKRYFARKCEVREITNKEAKPLLESSHLQGHVNSTVNLGLFYKDELVSVMGFSKSTQGENIEWELKRFSNKIDMVVIGGAERLFNAFIRSYTPESIKTFSMNRIFSGELYRKLGFKHIDDLPPTYFYHKGLEIILRRNAQKKRLHNLIEGYTYNKDKTEVETMNENGYFQIFDTGMSSWLWSKDA